MRSQRAVERQFVGLPSPVAGRAGAGGHPCQGLYHHLAGEGPRVAFIATHFNVDFAEHYLAEPLARRGFGFLGWNTRFRGNEAYFLLDHALAEIAVGVGWLREEAGAEIVVLLGNSGGGSLMAAYQSQAVDPVLEPAPGLKPLDAAGDLPPADLYVALAAHPGRPEVLTAWMDPSVTDEADLLSVDPALDPFDPDNGPPFDASFVDRYRAAQRDRNDRITAWALDELSRLSTEGVGDRLFTLSRTWADLRMLDGALDPSEREVPACYLGDPRRANYGVFGIGTLNTLRTWLNMWSLERSPCRAAPHLAKVALPSLVVQGLADTGVFPSDARAIADGLAADDVTLELIAGDHYFLQPDGARDDVADLLAAWVHQRA